MLIAKNITPLLVYSHNGRYSHLKPASGILHWYA